jgi:lipopolysaccharide heptosyltransferase II
MSINPSSIKKILIIKPRGIGDIVLSTILINNLKAHFPNAKIDYLTEPFAKPAVEHLPDVNKVLTMKRDEFPLDASLKIRKEKYDLLIDSWVNPRTALITFLSRIKYRVGYAYRGRKYAYNILATSERGGDHHSAEHNLELLKPIGVPVISKSIQFNVPDIAIKKAEEFLLKFLPKDKTVVGILPAGSWPSKKFDKERWVDICRIVIEKYNVAFLLLWGPGDKEDAEFIHKHFPENSVLIPETDLILMSAFIKQCDIIIANDSGPMHIAVALRIPVLGIFGPTDPKGHGPYSPDSGYVIKEDLFCIICNRLECPYNHECMKDLPDEKILAEFEKIGIKVLIKAN